MTSYNRHNVILFWSVEYVMDHTKHDPRTVQRMKAEAENERLKRMGFEGMNIPRTASLLWPAAFDWIERCGDADNMWAMLERSRQWQNDLFSHLKGATGDGRHLMIVDGLVNLALLPQRGWGEVDPHDYPRWILEFHWETIVAIDARDGERAIYQR